MRLSPLQQEASKAVFALGYVIRRYSSLQHNGEGRVARSSQQQAHEYNEAPMRLMRIS